MKHFLTMFIMLAAAMALHAQTKMIIRDVNGNTTTYTLQQGGVIEFDEGDRSRRYGSAFRHTMGLV